MRTRERETHHGKLGVEGWVDAEFELRRAAATTCADGAGHGGELVWDAAVAS